MAGWSAPGTGTFRECPVSTHWGLSGWAFDPGPGPTVNRPARADASDQTSGFAAVTARIASTRAAVEHGFAIECDLQLTADGKAVVFHDDSVDRVLDGKGAVRSLSVAQIQKMRFRGGKDRVQRLEELLEQVNGRQTLLIEIKSLWDDDFTLTHYVLDVLSNYRGPFAIMSFDENIISYAAERFPNIVRGLTADRCTDPWYDFMPVARRLERQNFSNIPQSRPHFISFNFLDLPFQPLGEIRRRGFPILSWTIENPANAAQALRYSDQITFENFIPK